MPRKNGGPGNEIRSTDTAKPHLAAICSNITLIRAIFTESHHHGEDGGMVIPLPGADVFRGLFVRQPDMLSSRFSKSSFFSNDKSLRGRPALLCRTSHVITHNWSMTTQASNATHTHTCHTHNLPLFQGKPRLAGFSPDSPSPFIPNLFMGQARTYHIPSHTMPPGSLHHPIEFLNLHRQTLLDIVCIIFQGGHCLGGNKIMDFSRTSKHPRDLLTNLFHLCFQQVTAFMASS